MSKKDNKADNDKLVVIERKLDAIINFLKVPESSFAPTSRLSRSNSHEKHAPKSIKATSFKAAGPDQEGDGLDDNLSVIDDSDLMDQEDTDVVRVADDAWMINPKNRFRMTWDLGLIMPFLIYLTIVMPFRLCFENEAVQFTPTYWFEFLIDMVFIADIVFNFRTGIFVPNPEKGDDMESVEYDRWLVAKEYLHSWFVLDVVSGVPFAAIELMMGTDSGAAGSLKSLKVLKLLRFLKLGRLLKFEKIMGSLDRDTLDRLEDFMQAGSTRTSITMTKLLFTLAFSCHVFACGFVLVGRHNEPGWLEADYQGPFTPEDTTGVNGGGVVYSIYLAAFYFSLTTTTSVGFGDIITHNNAERLYVVFVEFASAIIFATVIAAITSVVSSMDMNARKKAEQLDAVSSFVWQRQFPEHLGRRVRRHFRHFYRVKSAIDETKIFNELSTSLRSEVSDFLVRDLMGPGSFFANMSQNQWPRLLPLLRPMSFVKDEVVCEQGAECAEMYVVLSGHLIGTTRRDPAGLDPLDREVVQACHDLVRHIGTGSSVNTLHVLGIWHKCVETVVAPHITETYSASAADIASLFASDGDDSSFIHFQEREAGLYKMDKTHPSDGVSLAFGKPLYFACFSTVHVFIVQARSALAAEAAKSKFAAHEADMETWMVCELVEINSGKPFNEFWRYKTPRVKKSTGKEVFFGDDIRWSDVSVPLERAAVRLRLFEGPPLTEGKAQRGDVCVGRALMTLTDIERQAEEKQQVWPKIKKGGKASKDGEIQQQVSDWGSVHRARPGDVEAWVPLGPDHHESPMEDTYGGAGVSPDKKKLSQGYAVSSSASTSTPLSAHVCVRSSRPEQKRPPTLVNSSTFRQQRESRMSMATVAVTVVAANRSTQRMKTESDEHIEMI